MELRQLKTFQAVARLLSFHRAAEMLHYSQSTVSAQIKLLEEDLGVPLFNRLGKKVALTEAGETMLRHAEKLLAIENEARNDVANNNQAKGTITLRIPESIATYLLPEALHRLHLAYPNVNIDIANCAFSSLKHELRSGSVDLAFLIADQVAAAELQVEALGFVEIVAVVAPSHPLGKRCEFTLHCLQGETLLLPKQDCSYKMAVETALTEQAVTLRALMAITGIETIKHLVAQGCGVAILPETAIRAERRAGQLLVLPWRDFGCQQAVLLLRHKDKWLSPMLSDFIALARDGIAGTLAPAALVPSRSPARATRNNDRVD